MSKTNGKVTVSVVVPVFGTVKGTKTMQEIISGVKPKDDREERPAVVTKPLKAKVASRDS